MLNISEMSTISHAVCLLKQINTNVRPSNVQAIIMEKGRYQSVHVANFFNQIGK